MKNVINIILKLLKKIWDINLSIILFILYLFIFFPYKLFLFFKKQKKFIWWRKVDKYNINNKTLPY